MKKGFLGVKWTRDRKIIAFLCGYASGGLLLIWLIGRWRREDRENKAKEMEENEERAASTISDSYYNRMW